jgi:hypothetical protein
MPIRMMMTTSALALLAATPALAQEMTFNRIAPFPVTLNTPEAEETLAEIIAATGDGLTLIHSDSPADVPREPDAVQWIDTDHLVIANEGDMDGGSFDHAIVEIGHCPDDRSGNKGAEPEGMELPPSAACR